MTHGTDKLMRIGLTAVAGIGCLFGGDLFSPTSQDSWVPKAHAVIGRPLTPMSYAGVARRTTTRAVVATGAVAATAAPVVVAPAPACVQVVNAYGQITYRCP
jgi:hypothetical protein